MANHPGHRSNRSSLGSQLANGPPRAPHATYPELCQLEHLRQAYDRVRADARARNADTRVMEAIEEGGVDGFLRRLSGALRTKAYQSSSNPAADLAFEPAEGVAIVERVILAAITSLVMSRFADEPLRDLEPEAATSRVAKALEGGLTRVFAVNTEASAGTNWAEAVTDELTRRGVDADTAGLLRATLQSPACRDDFRHGPLAPLLASVLCAPIDEVARQVVAAGREGAVAHADWVRIGHQVVILVDRLPRFDWLFAAAKNRIRQELSKLGYDPDAIPTQEVDLSQGGQLSLPGYEVVVTGRGRPQVRYRKRTVEGACGREATAPRSEGALPRPRRWPGLGFVRRSCGWLYRRTQRVPIGNAVRSLRSAEVSWRFLPNLLSGLLSYGLRHKAVVVAAACGLAALGCLFYVCRDVYSHLSGETVPPNRPPGFLVGQYNPDPPWGTELWPYSLYVPPHFRGQNGPFPLIVFLHGYGERTKGKIFSAGVPLSVATRFGERSKHGRFEFVAFCPIDSTGQWWPGTPEVDNAMRVLDYIIKRHRIDPDRVYLTGISNGGSGVWRMAEAYPDRWAAVAPLGSFYRPDVSRVRHIPSWIFHGALDEKAPVEPQRSLVKELKKAGADVRYTEVPDKGHTIFTETYDARDVYDWFATKSRSNR